jgi:hypothetical protein
MDENRFRPNIDGLEDRFTPSVSPGDVVAAYTNIVQITHQLQSFAPTIGQDRTTAEVQYIASTFPGLVVEANSDVAVLSQYLQDLQTQIAQNPALKASEGQYLGGFGYVEFEGLVDAGYAELWAIGFGASPPPAPPVPPPPSDGVNFGSVGLPPGTSDSNPAGSTLPFSLANPAWQNLSSGVRILDQTVGTGPQVAVGDTINADYTGYLTNGTVFDSSAKSGQLTSTLSTSSYIAGIVDGIVGMQAGGTRLIDIPATLGYGSNAQGSIPANSELIFSVTLNSFTS